jgi:hypothetical protein
VAGQLPPEPWLTQKNRDWLSPFIARLKANVINSVITKPADYYKYDNFYRIGSKVEQDCEEEISPDQCDTPITILDGDKFNQRCITYIAGKKPSFSKPIGKIAGNEIEVRPRDLGSITLEYIRYPKFAKLGKKIDPDFNDEVPDPANSEDYEWGEWARELLVFWITDMFANHIREQALKQFNAATGKTVRG